MKTMRAVTTFNDRKLRQEGIDEKGADKIRDRCFGSTPNLIPLLACDAS